MHARPGRFTLAQAILVATTIAPPGALAVDPNWRTFGPPQANFNGPVYAVTQAGGVLHVGGDFWAPTGYIARIQGTEISALGSGLNGSVNALLWDAGELYAGGAFSSAGMVSTPGIALWNGGSWQSVGTGVGGIVHAIAKVAGNVYAAGSLWEAGGIAVNAIAAWDGSSWAPLDGGLDGVVRAMAGWGNQLYVGGSFVTGSGQTLNRIARWDGTQWHPLGSGLDGLVRAIALVDGDLYVGGDFSTAGGLAAVRLARWDGAAWHSVGTGANAAVHTLLEDRGDLLVGGSFTEVGGLGALRIARWDGSAWTTLGAGFNGTVRALAVAPFGVVATGAFSASGLVLASKVAKFDGDLWTSPINQAPDEIVWEIVVVGDDVYVGGAFTRVAGVPVNYVARWNSLNETWESVGGGLQYAPESPVRAMAYDSNRGELYCADQSLYNGLVNVVRWDGSAWSAVDPAFAAPNVHTLAYINGTLYAGGNEPSLNYIAKLENPDVLDGEWQSLGAGFTQPACGILTVEVRDIIGIDDDVYAGGLFGCATPTGIAYGLAQWNGSEWLEVGTWIEDGEGYECTRIWGLAYDGSSLFEITSTALGRFWNSRWSYYGGEGGYQATIEAINGNLYKGDEEGIQRWVPAQWVPLGDCNVNEPVVTIAGMGGNIFVSGTFNQAGCKPSKWFAEWQETVVSVGDEATSPPQHPVRVFPNPFNPSTTIQFHARADGIATVRVLNVNGQCVRTLLNQRIQTGEHLVSWDGRGTNGDRVASGVYFCEVRTSGGRAVSKLVLVK
jgi:hypothetical protein